MSDNEGWFPVAASADLVSQHIFQGKLLGQELAVWRADDGTVNVWENRCVHRGVRLSVGSNNGAELKCYYHGWRYASGSGGCTYIPAHPAEAPARSICSRTFPVVEHVGYVWTSFGQLPFPQLVDGLDRSFDDSGLTLRALPFDAPAELAQKYLAHYRVFPSGSGDQSAAVATLGPEAGTGKLAVAPIVDGGHPPVVLVVQPVDADACIVRGFTTEIFLGQEKTELLRAHSDALEELRTLVETEARLQPTPTQQKPAITPLAVNVSSSGERDPLELDGTQRVRVVSKTASGTDVVRLDLAPVEGALASYRPGAHIDVHLGNGLVRQYSLTTAAGESALYCIGVKLEPESRGGSAYVHESVKPGDELAVSLPRNSFTLRRDGVKSVLIAGGIGATPLLAMAQVLQRDSRPYELHHFVRSVEYQVLPELIVKHGEAATAHIGFDPLETADEIRSILSVREDDWHTYICGPGPMLSAAREIAAELGWPDDRVHFEYFKNETVGDNSTSFEIALARSKVTVPVCAGETILEVLRREGISMPSSCEQGACGTCSVAVLEGVPDHHDVHLNSTERAAGDVIMTCVSRSLSPQLVLDI